MNISEAVEAVGWEEDSTEMTDYSYRIEMADGTELAVVQAASAEDALGVYCADHPDESASFLRGGLLIDADTRGEIWLTVRTDAGRISVDKVDE